eukprot:scaffold207765_cov35-Tisochrysis_lutea.AAC.1
MAALKRHIRDLIHPDSKIYYYDKSRVQCALSCEGSVCICILGESHKAGPPQSSGHRRRAATQLKHKRPAHPLPQR